MITAKARRFRLKDYAKKLVLVFHLECVYSSDCDDYLLRHIRHHPQGWLYACLAVALLFQLLLAKTSSYYTPFTLQPEL